MDNGRTAFGTAEDVPGWPAYVSRQEAIKVLGVKPQTLYSYVSRGLVRRCVDHGGRSSAYNFQDIQRLKARSLARSGHGPAAANAIHWGEPVLLTAITKITERGPLYGEHLATDLARSHHRFESVAEYLWTGIGPADVVIWREGKHAGLGRQLDEITRFHPNVHIRQLLTEVALLLGMEQADAADVRGSRSDIEQARDLMQAMAGAFGFLGPHRRYLAPRRGDTIARILARALGLQAKPDVTQALDGVLVVVADHEFTPATFAARIAASAGNDLYSCVGAALQVHFGSALGLRCDLLEQCFGAAESPEMAQAAAAVSIPMPSIIRSIATVTRAPTHWSKSPNGSHPAPDRAIGDPHRSCRASKKRGAWIMRWWRFAGLLAPHPMLPGVSWHSVGWRAGSRMCSSSGGSNS